MAIEPESDLRIESPKQAYCDPSEINVNEEYQSMLPRPSEKEHEQMKESIKEDGQDKAIVIDQNMVLIDGHTRLTICKELNKQVFYEQKYFKDRTEILRHMAIANLHRRNLSQYQKVILYDELYKIEILKSRQRSILGKKISLLEKKGEDIKIFDLAGLTDMTDQFVIVTGNGNLHVKAIVDKIQDDTLKVSKPWHVEGYQGLKWVLLDYVDVVVHVFDRVTREYYDIERLWADAKISSVSD